MIPLIKLGSSRRLSESREDSDVGGTLSRVLVLKVPTVVSGGRFSSSFYLVSRPDLKLGYQPDPSRTV